MCSLSHVTARMYTQPGISHHHSFHPSSAPASSSKLANAVSLDKVTTAPLGAIWNLKNGEEGDTCGSGHPRSHGTTRFQFTYTQCHSPQEPVVPQSVLAPTDPRARPQEARHLPLQRHRGGNDLEGGKR